MLGLDRLSGTLLVTAVALATGCGGCEDDPTAQGGGGSPPVGGQGLGGPGGQGGQGGSGGEEVGGSGGSYVCPSPTTGTTFALTELVFGEGNSGQWKSVGFNVDGLVSDGSSTDVCQPNAGGNPDNAFPDGNDGIDNSFGKNLLPIILNLSPQFSDTVNGYLDTGLFNTMAKVYCLPPSGDASGLTTKIFAGTLLGSIPNYDGTDEWPVAPEVLADVQDPESSTLVFENSFVTGDAYDSGDPSTIILTIPIEFQDNTTLLKLTVYHARFTMTLSADRKSATGGTLGGVLNTEEVIEQLNKVGYAADYCTEDVFLAAINTVRQSSDIMSDGTQNPASTCDGISFGLAFEMAEVQLGPVALATPPTPSCSDGS